MMRNPILLLAGVVLSACQTPASQSISELESVREAVRRGMPSTTVRELRAAPVDGLYEVIAGQNVFYVDRSARYLFVGAMYDMQTRTDVTAKRIEAARHVKFSALPLEAAIVIRQGSGANRLAVFADPDCPYCRKLEPELAKIPDATIYVFLMPLPGHPDAGRKATAVWCAPDRALAWRALMLENREPAPPPDKCAAPLDRVAALARDLAIRATPSLVSEDGRLHAGFLASPQIEHWLREKRG